MRANQINWPTTIGNLGLWSELGITTKAAHLETHHLVRFFVRFSPALLSFCAWRATCAVRTVFILFGACNSNPNPPHDPKTQKTVMQSVMQR